MQVHIDTFKSTGIHTYGTFSREEFSVEITIKGDRRAVRCVQWGAGDDARLTIFGLAVKFNQGAKVWPGCATYWIKSGRVNNLTPNIDKRGTFILCGYSADFEGKSVRSQHNAVA